MLQCSRSGKGIFAVRGLITSWKNHGSNPQCPPASTGVLEQNVQEGDLFRKNEYFTASRIVFLLLLLTCLIHSPTVRDGFQLLLWRPWMNPQKPPAATGEREISENRYLLSIFTEYNYHRTWSSVLRYVHFDNGNVTHCAFQVSPGQSRRFCSQRLHWVTMTAVQI